MKRIGKNGLFAALVFLCSFWIVSAHTAGVHTVEMRDDGFAPEEITILQGDKVVFENAGAKSRWPASDIHPTHQIYAEFDAKEEVLPGESWEFTFEKAGTWKFHDHIYPEQTGVVSVEKDSDFVPSEKREAVTRSFFARAKDYLIRKYYALFPGQVERRAAKISIFDLAEDEVRLRYWTEMLGAPKIMERLLTESGGGSKIDCHQEAHTVGRIAYEVYGAKVFEEGDASCHSGFYHGAMEAFLKETGTDNLASKIKEVCSIFPTGFGNFECLHGVGHGIMALEAYDLSRSLRVCEDLEDPFPVGSCYGGVFMENIIAGQGGGALADHETEWVSDDPHFPCDAVDPSYEVQYQCYQMQTSWMLTLYDYDFDRVAKECLNARPDMVKICFKSYGRDAAGHVLRRPRRISALCEKVPERYYENCVVGALNVVVEFWGGSLKDQASELCRILPAKGKNVCYSTLSGRLQDVFNDDAKRRTVCDGFEEEYRGFCRT